MAQALSGRRLGLMAVTWALAGVLLAACTGDGGDGGGTADGEGASGRDGRTEPGADDVEAVVPYVEDLLAEHDRLVAEILADPSVADDPDHALIRQYGALFVPDSDLPDQVVQVWSDEAAAGVTVGPYDDEHPMVATSIAGEIDVVDGNEVRVPTCEVRRERTYTDGELTGGVPERQQAGETVAVRVDGEWLIDSRQVHDGATCEGGAA